ATCRGCAGHLHHMLRRRPPRAPHAAAAITNRSCHCDAVALSFECLIRCASPHSIMTERLRRVRRALLSVSDKSGLVEFARALADQSIELISTGGTRKALAEAGLGVLDISELTGFPEMMDGRVKTLHPKVHGGLLALRDNQHHDAAMRAHGIQPIDLLVVSLYPFEATVAKGAAFDTCIENIDIGGPAIIRGAAQNHAD